MYMYYVYVNDVHVCAEYVSTPVLLRKFLGPFSTWHRDFIGSDLLAGHAFIGCRYRFVLAQFHNISQDFTIFHNSVFLSELFLSELIRIPKRKEMVKGSTTGIERIWRYDVVYWCGFRRYMKDYES